MYRKRSRFNSIPAPCIAGVRDNPSLLRRRALRSATAVLVACGLALASGLGAGSAQANGPAVGPHHWCPGDHDSTAPTAIYNWDWNICHTYYWVDSDKGNVPYLGHLPSNLWDGDNPPGVVTQLPPCAPSPLPCL